MAVLADGVLQTCRAAWPDHIGRAPVHVTVHVCHGTCAPPQTSQHRNTAACSMQHGTRPAANAT
jgi:hypothetical protein